MGVPARRQESADRPAGPDWNHPGWEPFAARLSDWVSKGRSWERRVAAEGESATEGGRGCY